MKLNKKIIIIISVSAVFILGIILTILLGTGSITVSSPTSDILFTVNGKEYSGPQTIKNLKWGKYKLILESTRFEAEKYDIDVLMFQNVKVNFAAKELSEETALDKEEALSLESLNTDSAALDARRETILTKYPFVEAFPLVTETYTFDYEDLEDGNIQFFVEATTGKTYDKAVVQTELTTFLNGYSFKEADLAIDYR